MKPVISTHVPDAGSCSHLSCWTEAYPALWRELTSTRTSIRLSRQQLLPASWPNKWVFLEADHRTPALPRNPTGRLLRARSAAGAVAPFSCLSVRCSWLCRSSDLELPFTGLYLMKDSLNSDTILSIIMNKTDLPNNLMIEKKKHVKNISPISEKLITQPQKILPSNTI